MSLVGSPFWRPGRAFHPLAVSLHSAVFADSWSRPRQAPTRAAHRCSLRPECRLARGVTFQGLVPLRGIVILASSSPHPT